MKSIGKFFKSKARSKLQSSEDAQPATYQTKKKGKGKKRSKRK